MSQKGENESGVRIFMKDGVKVVEATVKLLDKDTSSSVALQWLWKVGLSLEALQLLQVESSLTSKPAWKQSSRNSVSQNTASLLWERIQISRKLLSPMDWKA